MINSWDRSDNRDSVISVCMPSGFVELFVGEHVFVAYVI